MFYFIWNNDYIITNFIEYIQITLNKNYCIPLQHNANSGTDWVVRVNQQFLICVRKGMITIVKILWLFPDFSGVFLYQKLLYNLSATSHFTCFAIAVYIFDWNCPHINIFIPVLIVCPLQFHIIVFVKNKILLLWVWNSSVNYLSSSISYHIILWQKYSCFGSDILVLNVCPVQFYIIVYCDKQTTSLLGLKTELSNQNT